MYKSGPWTIWLVDISDSSTKSGDCFLLTVSIHVCLRIRGVGSKHLWQCSSQPDSASWTYIQSVVLSDYTQTHLNKLNGGECKYTHWLWQSRIKPCLLFKSMNLHWTRERMISSQTHRHEHGHADTYSRRRDRDRLRDQRRQAHSRFIINEETMKWYQIYSTQ